MSQFRQFIQQGLLPLLCRLLGPDNIGVQPLVVAELMRIFNHAENDRALEGA